jgi:hypothetical protein
MDEDTSTFHPALGEADGSQPSTGSNAQVPLTDPTGQPAGSAS